MEDEVLLKENHISRLEESINDLLHQVSILENQNSNFKFTISQLQEQHKEAMYQFQTQITSNEQKHKESEYQVEAL